MPMRQEALATLSESLRPRTLFDIARASLHLYLTRPRLSLSVTPPSSFTEAEKGAEVEF
jgi:hypothetical protein